MCIIDRWRSWSCPGPPNWCPARTGRTRSAPASVRCRPRPKDLPYGEAPLAVRWHKRQFACRERLCKRKAFTESIAELPPSAARITGRTRRAAGASIGSGRSVRAVCGELPMSWPTAHAAFVDHAERLLVEPAAPQVLGIDETRRGRPRWSQKEDGSWSRLERFETNFVDLSGSGGLLGQTAGRTSKSVVAWLDERGEDWKAQVEFVAIDPCAAYRSAVQHALPHARLIADHFHLDRLAGEMVTDVRQREVLNAVTLLRRLNVEGRRTVTDDTPTGFVPVSYTHLRAHETRHD